MIVAIDGPISLAACVDGATGGCEAQETCPIRGRWDPVNEAIRVALTRVTLDQMVLPPPGGGNHEFDRADRPGMVSGGVILAAE